MNDRWSYSVILRLAAFVLFIVAAVLCFLTDAPDIDTVLGVISAGLACWVAGTIAP